MVSQKSQVHDIRTLLQVSQVRDKLEVSKLGTGQIRVIPIRYPNIAYFSDMSMGHKISLIERTM